MQVQQKNHAKNIQKTCEKNKNLTASFRKSELGGRRLGALTLSEPKCCNLLSERNTESKSNSLDFSVLSDFAGAVSLLFFAFSCFSGGEGLVGFSVGSSLMGSLFNDPVLPKNKKKRFKLASKNVKNFKVCQEGLQLSKHNIALN